MTQPHNNNKSVHKVLFVDDEQRLLSALRRRLANAFSLVMTTDPNEALEILAREDDIAVIVADMQMPEMNGIELLKRVKTEFPGVRRIMLTGNADQETAIDAINQGEVMRFLQKPCDTEDLTAALNHALEDYEYENDGSIKASPPSTPTAPDTAAALDELTNHLYTPLKNLHQLATNLETTASAGREKLTEALESIQEQSERASALARMLIAVKTIEAEPDRHQSKTVDAIALVHEEAERARERAGLKKVTLSVDTLRRRLSVSARDTELRFAMRELLTTSISRVQRGDHISIVIKSDGEHAAIRVAEAATKAPDAGFEADQEKLDLALAIVRTVAQSNNFSFDISAQKSGGCAATLTLLRAPEEASQAA
ncbi:MAG: response regulator [Pseudomonadota bacterium]